MSTPDLSYPIGRFPGTRITPENKKMILRDLAESPRCLRGALEGLSDNQLDTRYRPEGWTVRQVVHHVGDSHMHAYMRTRFAITQHEPTIMVYDEKVWASLKDARSSPVDTSLFLLDGLHARWVELLESLADADWSRRFVHPERGVLMLDQMIPIYAWHGIHHTAHITELRKRMGW